MKSYSRTVLANQNLSSITDLRVLSKILPGLTKTDLNNIDTNSKIISIVNILNASLIDNMPLNSIQVRFY